MIEKKYTDKQKRSFATRLKQRVEKMDPAGKLEQAFESVGYCYATGLNFGKLFKHPNASPLIAEFQEAMDNAGTENPSETLLVFSRPSDVIYIMASARLYWLSQVRPLLVVDTQALGLVAISRLDNFLEAMP